MLSIVLNINPTNSKTTCIMLLHFLPVRSPAATLPVLCLPSDVRMQRYRDNLLFNDGINLYAWWPTSAAALTVLCAFCPATALECMHCSI